MMRSAVADGRGLSIYSSKPDMGRKPPGRNIFEILAKNSYYLALTKKSGFDSAQPDNHVTPSGVEGHFFSKNYLTRSGYPGSLVCRSSGRTNQE
jgi:hypothetical protein